MHYIDTGSRDPTHTLADWLEGVLTPSVTEVRWQSGFFNENPLGLFAPTLRRLAKANRTVHALIGSNAPGTQRDDVLRLVQLLGLPRQHARLGVVRYGNAFYHPKTYHFRRDDGSQCAYVGSANLTDQGVTSLHIEAGLTLDTRDGDPAAVLNQIADAVDAWFVENRQGLHAITDAAVVDQLVFDGVLELAPPPHPPAPPAASTGESAGGGGLPPLPMLHPLASLPALPPARPVVPAPTGELPQSPITPSVRCFLCNTNRKWSRSRGRDEGLMHQHCLAAAWMPFQSRNHMQQVQSGHLIFMFAKGVGIIGVGQATGPYRVLAAGNPDRIGNYPGSSTEDEWQVPVVWLRWQPEAPCVWNKYVNQTFVDVSGDDYTDRRRLAWQHFGL